MKSKEKNMVLKNSIKRVDYSNRTANIKAFTFEYDCDRYAQLAHDFGTANEAIVPWKSQRLLRTVQHVQSLLKKKVGSSAMAMNSSMYDSHAAPRYLNRIQWKTKVKENDVVKLIPTDDVECFYSDDKYTIVQTSTESADIRKSIKELVEELNPEHFARISRSTIVNLRKVGGFTKEDGHYFACFKDCSDKKRNKVKVEPKYSSVIKPM